MSKSTVILDTSCWIEFFLGSGRAASYAHHVGTSTVIVPSLCLFEVVRTLLKNFDNEHVLRNATADRDPAHRSRGDQCSTTRC
jgi:toxin FitB